MSRPARLDGWHDVDTSTPIFVLRRSLAEFQHCVLGIARSAGRLGIPVYAVRRQRREPATRSRYIRRGLVMPPAARDEQWLEVMTKISQEIGRAMLLPIDDDSAVFVADHRQSLAAQFLLPDQPEGLARRLASKRELWDLCQQLGLPTPASTFPTSEQELLALAAEHTYPVVLKRSEPWLPTNDPNAPSVFIARTPDELVSAYGRMESPVRPQLMLQQYVPGDSESVWMFNGYFGRDSACLCAFTGRKLRQYRPRTGPTSLGVCEANETVKQAATALMAHIGYRGIVDMGFRHDVRDGQYKLLDVNPRIGSTFRLFLGEGGLDVMRAQYLDLTGQQVPASSGRDGRRWIVEPTDVASCALLARERSLGLRGWLNSVRGVDEAAWWARDDPLPFLAMCARAAPYAYRSLTDHNRA